MNVPSKLIDQFRREITYLRLSVTDRCDFRCVYCMSEDMTFLPRKNVLTLEEMAVVATAFRELGVTKLRVTGGEPLVRRDILQLLQQLGRLKFDDLCLTTNGSQLQKYAHPLVEAGVHRINISLDTLHADRFKQLTRTGHLSTVLKGIETAKQAGFKRIKINSVILKNHNSDEIIDLAEFALNNHLDISFIEEMPLGTIASHNRKVEFISSSELRERLATRYDLIPTQESSNGPSRYWRARGFDSRLGFISPHSENFCSTCNRVRVSAEGKLLLCLGNEADLDLRAILRSPNTKNKIQQVQHAIIEAMQQKPEKHEFNLDAPPQILRFMNATGG